MCLLLLAIKRKAGYKLVLAANRDEYYDRPTAPARFWKEAPNLLAGQDLRAGGTWLGITRNGRIAAITNYRDPATLKSRAPSRGKLVTRFLLGNSSPRALIDGLAQEGNRYNGFNLVLGTKDSLWWYSNRAKNPRSLDPGYYGLSNHLLDTPWPKVVQGKESFTALLSQDGSPAPESLFHMLGDRRVAPDESLPDTGVGLEWERILSSVFITSPTYGTRSSTLVFIDNDDKVSFLERTFTGQYPEHQEECRYEFSIGSSPSDTVS